MAIIRNLTASPLELSDLDGITVPASGDYDLLETPQQEIDASTALAAAVSAGNIVFLDEFGNQLTQVESQNILIRAAAPVSAISVRKDGVGVVGTPHNVLNFSNGGLIITDSANGVVDIDGSVIDSKRDKIAGFEDRTTTTFTFDENTGTATVTPVSADFTIWSNNTKFTFTTAQSIVVPTDVVGRVVYFDDNGVLTSIPTPPDGSGVLLTNCIVAATTANVGDSLFNQQFDLRFDVDMDPETRFTFVLTTGTLYNSGLLPSNITPDASGSNDTSAQLSITDGVVSLADITHSTVDDNQTISFPAQIPIAYLIGDDWNLKVSDDFPFIYGGSVGGDYTGTRVPYNRIQHGVGSPPGRVGSLVQVTNNDFVLVHFFASLGVNDSIIGIMGQNQYTTRNSARQGAKTEIEDLLLNPNAIRYYTPIGSLIIQTADSYNNVPKARFRTTDEGNDFEDFRSSKIALSSAGLGNPSFREEEFNVFDSRGQKVQFSLENTDPNINTVVKWKISSANKDFDLVPDYELFAPAAEPLLKDDLVSMDINGKIQKFPQVGGEAQSTFTTRSVLVSSLEYISNSSGVVVFTDSTPNTVFFQGGTVQPNGTVLWGVEVPLTLSGNAIEISSTKINTRRCAFTIVQDDGVAIVVVISNSGNIAIIDDSQAFIDVNVISAGLVFNKLNHLVVGYIRGTTSVRNEQFFVDASGNLTSGGITRSFNQVMDGTKINVTYENDNIISAVLKNTNSLYIAEARWDSIANNYGDKTGYLRFGLSGSTVDIAGMYAENGTIFVQALKTSGNFETHYGTYDTGVDIHPWSTAGTPLVGKIAKILRSNSGAGFNAVINVNDEFELYSLDVLNILAGWTLNYTSILTVPSSSVYDNLSAIFMESTYTMIIQGDTAVNNEVYFISASAIVEDKLIGNSADNYATEDISKINIILPVINHTPVHPKGHIYSRGPYTFQSIGDHKSVVFLDEIAEAAVNTLTLGSLSDVQLGGSPVIDDSFIKYNSLTGQWEIAAIPTGPAVCHRNNGSVTQTFTHSLSTIIIGTDVRTDASTYTVTNNEVTVLKSGWYKIEYEVSSEATTGARSSMEHGIEKNSSEVTGARSYSYHRTSSAGEDTAHATIWSNLAANDVIRIRSRELTGNTQTIANACRLTLEYYG